MSRPRYDLHVHSTASDGTLPPREVVALAAERGLAGIALTDHDTCDGIDEAQGMAHALGLTLIPGVELSCSSPHSSMIHLLGYYIDHEHAGLQEIFQQQTESRMQRAAAIITRLNELHPGKVTLDDVLNQSEGRPPGRPHIARAMSQSGIIDNPDDAFTQGWLTPGGRVFVKQPGVEIGFAIKAIHAAGGVAVFAHPGARSKTGLRVDAVRHAATLGLDGVEVDHPGHEGEIVEQCAHLAKELNLIQTAGSDDHGTGIEGSRLGCRTVPQRVVLALEARAKTLRVEGQ